MDKTTKYYVNPNVEKCVRIFPEQGRYDYYRYDMNENPEGLPEDFVKDTIQEITPEFLATYPEPDIFLNKYAKFIGVDFENVLSTNGSDMAIRYLLEIFCKEGNKVVTINPSFEMYAVNCSILGLRHKPVDCEEDLSVCVEKIIEAIDDETDVVVLLNPNNPIGKAYTTEEMCAVVDKAREKGAIVIVDEAYHYFYDKTFIPKALEYDNVVVLRTFSKLFSMAACRLGLIISNKTIIDCVRKSRLTFEVNAVALKFAERLLDKPDIITNMIEEEKAGKQYTIDTLRQRGYEVIDGIGNYVFVRTRKDTHDLEKNLKQQKRILIKTYGNKWLKDYIRVSVGSTRVMQYFVDALIELDCQKGEKI